MGWLPVPRLPTVWRETLIGAPGLCDVKSTVGGVPRRATMSTTAAAAARANKTTVTVTFHAKLMPDLRFRTDRRPR